MRATAQHYKWIKRFREKFYLAVLAVGLGAFIAVLPITAIAQPHYEYEEEQFIQITPEVYDRLSESLANNTKPNQKRLRTYPGISGQILCSCVQTARAITNKKFGPIGYARNLKGNTDSPEVGDIVILNESPSGHLAVIKQIWADTYVIMEGNYERCAYTEREISKTYNKIIGFYR